MNESTIFILLLVPTHSWEKHLSLWLLASTQQLVDNFSFPRDCPSGAPYIRKSDTKVPSRVPSKVPLSAHATACRLLLILECKCFTVLNHKSPHTQNSRWKHVTCYVMQSVQSGVFLVCTKVGWWESWLVWINIFSSAVVSSTRIF